MYITMTIAITTDRADYTLIYDLSESKGAHNIFLYRRGSRNSILEMATIQDNILTIGQKCILRGYRNYLLPTTMTQIDLGVIRNMTTTRFEKKVA